METTFGTFLRRKREDKEISLRVFSRMVGISPEYLSKIENGVRPAPKDIIVDKIAYELKLSEEQTDVFYDLAAKSKNKISLSTDLILYINENETIRKILRLGKRCNVDSDDWQNFLSYLSGKYL